MAINQNMHANDAAKALKNCVSCEKGREEERGRWEGERRGAYNLYNMGTLATSPMNTKMSGTIANTNIIMRIFSL
jgi:hypothetical protein